MCFDWLLTGYTNEYSCGILTSISGIQCGCHGDCHLPQLTGSTIFMQIKCIAQEIQFWEFMGGSSTRNEVSQLSLSVYFVAAKKTISMRKSSYVLLWSLLLQLPLSIRSLTSEQEWELKAQELLFWPQKFLAFESIATHDLIQQKKFNSWNLRIKTACNLIG